MPGDVTAPLKAALPEESFRGGNEWNELAILPVDSSSVGSRGVETVLDDLLVNMV